MSETVLTKIFDEHKKLFQLLDQVESSKDYFLRLELFNRVKLLIVAHMIAEERAIYSRFRKKALIKLSDREHHDIKEYLQRLNLINFGSNEWLDVFKHFRFIVEKHCEDEENDMFTEARKEFTNEELVDFAKEFEKAKSMPAGTH